MKFVDEYRGEADARKLVDAIRDLVTRPWTLMEICGGQTHTLIKSGIDRLLPPEVTMVHGPGCPVCVTPIELIDRAVEIARRPGVIFTSFGDMLRVPGSSTDLLHVKSEGGDVRIVYSPLDALTLARAHPDRHGGELDDGPVGRLVGHVLAHEQGEAHRDVPRDGSQGAALRRQRELRVPAQPVHPVDAQRLLETLRVHLARAADAGHPTDLAQRVLRDPDLSAGAVGLDAGREVHGAADGRAGPRGAWC